MFTTRPELLGTFGMVGSTHWLASSTGMAVLEDGGNAYDAAVAAGFVLHVVEPHLNGVGGEMPLIGHEGATGRTFVVSGQGVSPAAATAGAFTDLGLDVVPGTGLLAATVPGSFGAWMHILAAYGTKSLREVLRYAIGYAAHGHPVLPGAAAAIKAVAPVFTEHWGTSAEVYLPGGAAPRAGALVTNAVLAATLERIVTEAEAASRNREVQIEAARRAFYSGFVAEAIDAFAATKQWDGSGEPHAGLLTGADLDSWVATEEDPLLLDVAGATVAKTGPWGQGPVMLQQLAMLDALDIGSAELGSAEMVHTVTEVAKLAFADREAYYGDPDHVRVPIQDLLSPAYAAQRATLVGPEASTDFRPGSPGGTTPHLGQAVLAAMAADAGHDAGVRLPGQGEPTLDGGTASAGPVAGADIEGAERAGRGDTCHLDVVDRWGNAVSATPSGGWLQSSPVVPGLGFALGTRAQMFWLEQGLPASIAPRRRPRTTLSPGMVLREHGPMAFGTPGGDQQDQWTIPFLIAHLFGGHNLQASIDAPSWHTTHLPSSFYPRQAEMAGLHVESRLGEQVLAELRRRGHRVTDAGPWSLGFISAAGRRADGLLHAGANPRRMQGYAVGR
ncbi:gamma-glutamyltransferase family protein [Pseudactinotalea sp. Z1739]|uniref:gamma-glutamyltransferase family protein n=1 Tax=Pseudactinotalea sp. Z1739 TaxID=3413028 RepID=UPI003C7AC0DB